MFIIAGTGVDRPYQVDISNCTAQPCPLIRGVDTVLKIDFFARKYLPVLTTNE